ncbi:MAG: glycosyltransferase [Patescibacteria group bacterium]
MSKNNLIFTTSEGHLSIAKALAAFLQGQSVNTELVFREEAGLKYYQFLYRHTPYLFAPFYHLSKNDVINFFLKKYLLSEHQNFTEETIISRRPNIVFNTSFGFNESLLNTQSRQPFTFINIVPNPRTFFLQDLAPADVTCVFDEREKKDVQKILPHSEIIQTGWFVRPEFEQPYSKKIVRKELGFDEHTPLFLFVTGSEGTESVLDLIETTSQLPHIQLAVACGNNKNLLDKVSAIAEQSVAPVTAIPFTTEIYKYMQAADLVVGKGGPNMIFESMATHTPFFVTTHISGLEDGNSEVIKEYGVGFVEENVASATKKMKQLVENPEKIEELQPNIKKLASYNVNYRKNLLSYLQ